MSIHSLESIQKNVNEVFRAQLTGGNCFLDGQLNITTDSSQCAKLETIIRYMQDHNWRMDDESNCKLEKTIRLGLKSIYKDDPLIRLCNFKLVHKSPEDYASLIQKQLSTVFAVGIPLLMACVNRFSAQNFYEEYKKDCALQDEVIESLSNLPLDAVGQRIAHQYLLRIDSNKKKLESRFKEILS